MQLKIFACPPSLLGWVRLLLLQKVKANALGCWFHFIQSIFCKAQELGFQQRYQDDVEFRNEVKLLSALAFVPKQDLKARFL